MITWPDSLVTELAEKRCVVFMGSGASAASVSSTGGHPPSWRELLDNLSNHLHDAGDKSEVKSLLAKERYLDAAEVIKENVDSGDFQTALRNALSGDYEPSAIHKAIYDIDAKVVITTNYDQIYEKYCSRFSGKPFYNTLKHSDTNILDDIRSDTRLLLKAHGCLSSVGGVVLGRSSYFEAKRRHTGFYAILDALFLTNTILFVGASLNDPDIQLILENATIAAPSERKHYALVPSGTHPSLVKSAERSYNMKFLEYPEGNYAQLNDSLADLVLKVEAYSIL